jgi:hypothetical protein
VVEVDRVEIHDALHTERLHGRNVYRITSRQAVPAQHDVFGAPRPGVDSEDVVDDGVQRVEGRLDGIASRDGDGAMQDLLEHCRVGHQALVVGGGPLQHTQRGSLVSAFICSTVARRKLVCRGGCPRAGIDVRRSTVPAARRAGPSAPLRCSRPFGLGRPLDFALFGFVQEDLVA